MTKTQNYQLNQWDAADPIRREDFNSDNAAIDAAIAAVKSEAAAALAGYQTSNDAAVASKADANAVTALEQSIHAALGSGGKNCRIAWGSYTGTGTYGESDPVTLNFSFCPVVVIVGSDTKYGFASNPTVVIRERSKVVPDCFNGNGTTVMFVTWTDTGLSWYNPSNPAYQNNESGVIYYYAVIGYDKNAG